MASILHPFVLVAKAVRAFFVSDVRVRRGQRGLEVVLAEPPVRADPARVRAKSRSGARAGRDPATEKNRGELRRMQQSLARLLDELPENRKTLRHLAFMEQALGKKGLRAMHKVPFDVLKRALEQFEGLVVNWSDEGLAALRSKMAVALIEREPDPSARVAGPPVESSPLIDSAPLDQAEVLEGEEAAAAEAALLAAYGDMVMPATSDDPIPAAPGKVELQGELNSPSGKALTKAMRRDDELQPAELQLRVPQA